MLGNTRGHVSDRSESEHSDSSAVWHRGVLHGLPGRGQHIGQVNEAVVGGSVGNLDVRELSLWDAQVFGLAARDLAVQLGETKQGCAHALVSHLGCLTLCVKGLLAHVAVPAGDLERDDDAVTDREVADLGPDFLHNPHRFVAHDVTGVHERGQRLIQVQVRTADVRAGDLDDRVGGLFDRGIGNVFHPDVPLALPRHSLHGALQP